MKSPENCPSGLGKAGQLSGQLEAKSHPPGVYEAKGSITRSMKVEKSMRGQKV